MTDPSTLTSLQDPARELRRRFEAAIEAARRPLWRYCVGLTGSVWDGEDLAQETVVRALGKLHQFGQVLDPRAYLFRIASNAWIDQCRRARPAEDIDGAAMAAEAAGPPPPPSGLATVQEVVRVLPPRQRVVYLLVEAFGYPAADVGAMLGLTEGAVKALLNRARTRVRGARADTGRAAIARVPASAPVLGRYLDAFNRRDVEALAALFHDRATTEIVGDWEEHGLETMRKYSLAFWAEAGISERAEAAVVDGREVVLVLERRADGTEALSSIVALDTGDGRITTQRWFFYTPETLEYVAAGLGVPSVTHGHRYTPVAAGDGAA